MMKEAFERRKKSYTDENDRKLLRNGPLGFLLTIAYVWLYVEVCVFHIMGCVTAIRHLYTVLFCSF